MHKSFVANRVRTYAEKGDPNNRLSAGIDFWRQNLLSNVYRNTDKINPSSAELICKKHRNQKVFSI